MDTDTRPRRRGGAVGSIVQYSLARGSRAETRLALWPAEEALAHLKAVEAQYPGLEHVAVASAMGTPRVFFAEQLPRFAEK